MALFEEHEGKIAPIATELKASWGHTKRWLVDAGIISEDYVYQPKQTPTPEPEELGGENRNEGEGEPAAAIIPKDDSFHIISGVTPASLGLTDNTTELQDKEMAKGDTIQEEEAGEYYPDWPPKDPIERALLEATMNAHFAVKRVVDDPVALALMKQVLGSGVI